MPSTIYSVDRKSLEQREYDDVHRVLQTVPGVHVRNEDGFGLRPNIGMRGTNPERAAKLTVMQDGISLAPAPYSAPAIFHFPLTTRMVGVEVTKGPASIRYGPRTIAGAIDLSTREIPLRHTMVLDVAGGRFGYAKAHGFYGTTWRGIGVLVEAAHLQSAGFKRIDGGGPTGFGANDGALSLGYTSRSDRAAVHRLVFSIGAANESSHETYLGLAMSDFEASPYRRYAPSENDRFDAWRTTARLGYSAGTSKLWADTRAYRHDGDRVWHRLDRFRDGPGINAVLADPGAPGNRRFAAILRGEADSVAPGEAMVFMNNDWRTASEGVRSTLHWQPRWSRVTQDLEVSLGVHHDWISRHTTENLYRLVDLDMLRVPGEPVDARRNRGETVAGTFHLWDAVTIDDRFTLSGGLRVEVVGMRFVDPLQDLVGRRTDVPISPALGALVQATKWLGAFAGVHRGFSPVAPGQPKSIAYEQSINYELGLRALHRGLFAEVIGYVADYRNLNGTCTFGPDCGGGDDLKQFNAGRALIGGAEASARWYHELARSPIHLELAAEYSFTHAAFRNAFHSDFGQWGDVVVGDRLPYVPEHVVAGSVGVGARRWDVSVRPYHQGAMRDVAGQGAIAANERVGGYFVLDASAEVRVLGRLAIYCQGGNLTASQYVVSRRPYGVRPGAPLTVMVGVKLSMLP